MAKGAYMVIGYPEDPSFNLENALSAILASGAEYSYILHDKDTYDKDFQDDDGTEHKAGDLKKPHYHIFIGWERGFPSDFKRWKEDFCKPNGLVAPSKKKCIIHNPIKAYEYMIHKNEK